MNTPDMEWEKRLRIDFEVAYGSMPKNFEHVPSVHISDWWLEKLSSRDTYWKERVRALRKELWHDYHNAQKWSEQKAVADALDTLLDNLK